MAEEKKPKVGIFSMTCCEGCQLEILNLEDVILDVVDKIDNAKDNSFFGNDLYSGAYKGMFSAMDLDFEEEDSINENMGIALINHFMSSIIFGAGDLNTPITQKLLKAFMQEEKTIDKPEN